MKYGIFELTEDPEISNKNLKILKDEAISRGWQECKNPKEVQVIVLDMIKNGFALIENSIIGEYGPSGLGENNQESWGRGLYFFRKGRSHD